MDYAEILISSIKKEIDISKLQITFEPKYQNIVACIIDAVYSIRMNYVYLEPKVEIFSNSFHSDHDSITVFLNNFDIQKLCQIFGRNRTSAKGGISKAEASIRFAEVLRNHGIISLKTLNNYESIESVIIDLEKIPGQSRHVSIAYFFMLAGNTSKIKIDSRIIDFTFNALGFRLKSEESYIHLYAEVVKRLKKEFPQLNLRSLDYALWKVQREK